VVLAELFAEHADAAVLHVLQDSARAMAKAEIIDALVAAGVEQAVARDAWDRVQRRISQHHRVVLDKQGRQSRYRWDPQAPSAPSAPSPDEAFERIVTGNLAPFDREELVEVVRSALAVPSTDRAGAADQSQQLDLDAARALAEMAIEVEELAAKQASARAMIHRVRARMRRMRLEPIDHAGDEVPFDRQRHQTIGPDIRDGAPVVVVRPGYMWRTPEKDLLIERPVVQD
jgi:hypothetical protein